MRENDKRLRQRFDMRVQVRIRNLDSAHLTEQRVESSNISARGVYFSTDLPLDIDARVEMFLTMPVEIAGKDSRLRHCAGRVVRRQPRCPSQAKAGNGGEIHYYEMLDKGRAAVANPRSGIRSRNSGVPERMPFAEAKQACPDAR